MELATVGGDHRQDFGVAVDPFGRERLGGQCAAAVWRLEQPHGLQRQRQLVKVLNQPLYASVDQILGRALGRVRSVDQSGDVFQQPTVAGSLKGGTHRINGPFHLGDSVQEIQKHVLLACDDHIGPFAAIGESPKKSHGS